MNEPIRKIQGANFYILNGKQITLSKGFTPTAELSHFDKKGNPVYFPNRKKRRESIQKAARRKAFGLQKRIQYDAKTGKTIIHGIIRTKWH